MANKYSLHIGLNNIDSNKYSGVYKPLNNAENDANYYFDFAQKNNFKSIKLIGSHATTENFVSELGRIRISSNEGDLIFISFSGHGTRVKDINNDELEKDGFDEALVFHDRILLDDELQNLWHKFTSRRIFFLSDSCFNGRVSRLIEMLNHNLKFDLTEYTFRGVDSSDSEIDFKNNIGFYKSIKTFNESNSSKKYSLIHIASCQNNQIADDGSIETGESYFTGVFKKTIEKHGIGYSYRDFFEKLMYYMPPWQTPNWELHSKDEFENINLLE